jgi:hemin uptake protein HemP
MDSHALRRSDPVAMSHAKGQPAMKAAVTGRLDAGALFAGGNEVVITHGAEIYRLRLTRQNKLILTK